MIDILSALGKDMLILTYAIYKVLKLPPAGADISYWVRFFEKVQHLRAPMDDISTPAEGDVSEFHSPPRSPSTKPLILSKLKSTSKSAARKEVIIFFYFCSFEKATCQTHLCHVQFVR